MKNSLTTMNWRRRLGCVLLCFLSIYVFAQTSAEQLKMQNDDINQYHQAANHILKEGKVREGVAILTELIGKRENETGYSLTMLASYYSCREQGWINLKEYQHAVDDGQKALSLLTKAGNEGKKDLPGVWYRQSLAYYYWGKPKEAMDAINECIKACCDYYGPLHSETLNAYSLRSNFAGFYNNRKLALLDRQRCFDIIRKSVEQNFTYLTTSERASYWNKYQPETTVMFTFAHRLSEWQSDFTDDLYNQQLLAKGLLLTAETALQRAIEKDESLSVTYKKIRQLRKQATEAKDDNALIEAERLEHSLGASANDLYQFMDFLKVGVADVRAKLKPTDIAVEFVDYRIGKDSVMYAALVLSPQWQHVRFIPLIESREIPQLQDDLTSRIWKPILSATGNNVKNIFFSPTGLLYQLPIESYLLSDAQFIGKAYCLYRMSSTRWLALNGNNEKGKDAVVYGGLDYDISVEELQQDAKQYPQTRLSDTFVRTRSALSGLKYLPATKTEAEIIAKTLNDAIQNNLHVNLFVGKQGTEASFKSLDGQHKQIVHIATHGFYDDDKSASVADALSRCGIYFAGADNRLQGEPIPKDIDDGILTAHEISSLDLRGLSLIALSACQTGQGKITGDGVFGLQRGFKKAGAQSILMSLWKVDDEATCLLMTEFYKNWIGKGETKHDALELAKQTVRSHKEKGWDDPKYWAAFILLDGLD